ncbi:endonuclease VIII [Pelotomaculum sp. PtaB.Bin117]|uniref:endonuclease VIII n=1 Tax=Pelotomaculum sp. PtaB.Bin117 TaxID=1811694 RepID=UPI0009C4E385|nr:endonuclease VIII [Pelotomaculum sp. PtaB.Bin117]OPX89657.1 MAG: Formamidopyrimidine-DNA glycosylase [Pelotomaculum sp. PtaB.Bin117]OPY63433.1 MAG: Formamidopyrimidine-DNA glycosylase [Pelotomaculum sp. PtaU1.Bin065]
MIELPEALTLASQINDTVGGKRIKSVIAAYTPHKFAWYHGDPQNYHDLLAGKTIAAANGYGGFVEIKAGTAVILIGDGVGFRYHGPKERRPPKHQLLIEFADLSAVSATIQMYGGIMCFRDGELDNPYYKVAKEKPSPLSDGFDKSYFEQLISSQDVQKLSAKAFLATGQRIPGLGNGVLQDILWQAQIHPKRKINTLSDEHKARLFHSVKTVLSDMAEQGGRDTMKDLFGKNGGYKTMMSKNSVGHQCPVCAGSIKKESYMGGSVYYCENCQVF